MCRKRLRCAFLHVSTHFTHTEHFYKYRRITGGEEHEAAATTGCSDLQHLRVNEHQRGLKGNPKSTFCPRLPSSSSSDEPLHINRIAAHIWLTAPIYIQFFSIFRFNDAFGLFWTFPREFLVKLCVVYHQTAQRNANARYECDI